MTTAVPLGELQDLGPFFAVRSHVPLAAPPHPWQRLDELLDGGPVLRERVGRVRQLLAAGGGQHDDAVEWRVAASVTHLGIAARLCSPVLAVAVGSGRVLDLADAWWQPVTGGAVPLSVTGAGATVEELIVALRENFVGGPLRRLDDAVARFSLSAKVRWGNVASALNGAATMLGSARPEWTDRIRGVVSGLLDQPPLRGTATSQGGRFRRRSCCLIYRAAPDRAGAVCGDCVLTRS